MLLVSYIIINLTACSTTQQLEKAVKNQDYGEALTVYKSDILGNSEQEGKTREFLIEVSEDYYNNFREGIVEFNDAKIFFDYFSDLAIVKEELSETWNNILKLYDSMNSYLKGIDYLAEGNNERAIECLDLVIVEDINYIDAQEKLNSTVNSYRDDILTEATKRFSNSDYESAIKMIEKGLQVISNDQELTNRLKEIEEERDLYLENLQIESTLDQVDILTSYNDFGESINLLKDSASKIENNKLLIDKLSEVKKQYVEWTNNSVDRLVTLSNYEGAISILKDSIKNMPQNNELSSKLQKLERDYKTFKDNELKTSVLDNVNDYIDNQEYAEAIDLLNNTLESLTNDVDLITKLSDVKDQYTEWVIGSVEPLITNRDFEVAVSHLLIASLKMPDNVDVLNKLEYCQDRIPIKLSDLTGSPERVRDFNLFAYNEAVYMDGSPYNDVVLQVPVVKKYDIFSGSFVYVEDISYFVSSQNTASNYENMFVIVEIDGNEIGQWTITPTGSPQKFELDISGGSLLNVIVREGGGWIGQIAIIDAILYKE
ncbi:hypothetical protein RI065_02110 [Mycoplasmatota bacterium zrk1]